MRKPRPAAVYIGVALCLALAAELCSKNRREEYVETKPKIEKPAGLGSLEGTAPQGVPGTEAVPPNTGIYDAGNGPRFAVDGKDAGSATVDLREWTKGESDGRDHQHEATAANSGGVDKPRLPLTSSDGPDAPKPDSTGRPRVSEANAETAKLQAETLARTRPVDRYPWKWQRDADGWRLYSGTTKTAAKAMPCNSEKVKFALTAPIIRTRSENGAVLFSDVRTGFPNIYCTALDGSLQRRNPDDEDHDLVTVMATHEWIERGVR